MPVLVFRHGLSGPLGLFAEALDSRNVEWQYVDLWRTPASDLAVELAPAVIVLGGSMSVNDPLPWLRLEERYITAAISSGVPVFGICLGAQLLAKCLGARVEPMGHKEIGWFPVRFTESGRTDPVLEGLPEREVFFHWHGENFEVPPGAERLAESDLCPNQAFRSGANLYGVQFHPEVSPAIIESWLAEDAACGEFRETTVPIDAHANGERMRDVAGRVFGNWCDLVAIR